MINLDCRVNLSPIVVEPVDVENCGGSGHFNGMNICVVYIRVAFLGVYGAFSHMHLFCLGFIPCIIA